MTILVTGATGNVGRNVVEQLVAISVTDLTGAPPVNLPGPVPTG